MRQPIFASSMVSETFQSSVWISTVEINGEVYLGECARNKKLSAQKAASTAIKCVLENGDMLMVKILQGKRLINVVPSKLKTSTRRSSRPRKKRKLAQ